MAARTDSWEFMQSSDLAQFEELIQKPGDAHISDTPRMSWAAQDMALAMKFKLYGTEGTQITGLKTHVILSIHQVKACYVEVTRTVDSG